jgi:hypothetical protein
MAPSFLTVRKVETLWSFDTKALAAHLVDAARHPLASVCYAVAQLLLSQPGCQTAGTVAVLHPIQTLRM